MRDTVTERTEPKAENQELEPPVLPAYAPPRVVTYRGEEILEELGPAQACSFLHSVVLC